MEDSVPFGSDIGDNVIIDDSDVETQNMPLDDIAPTLDNIGMATIAATDTQIIDHLRPFWEDEIGRELASDSARSEAHWGVRRRGHWVIFNMDYGAIWNTCALRDSY